MAGTHFPLSLEPIGDEKVHEEWYPAMQELSAWALAVMTGCLFAHLVVPTMLLPAS